MTIMTRPDSALIANAAPFGAASADLMQAIAGLEAASSAANHAIEQHPDFRHPERDAAMRAEEAAYSAVLAAPCRTRADAETFLSFVRPALPENPADDTLSKLADLLERALRGEFQAVAE